MKGPTARIHELEEQVEALANAIEEIREAMYEPKVTLPQAKHGFAQALMKLRRLKAK
jgi:uncharacterized coiled-coil protein SlyX